MSSGEYDGLIPDDLRNAPNIDLHFHDLRSDHFGSQEELYRGILLSVEETLDQRGWDQPDLFAAIHAGKPANPQDRLGTSLVWVGELTVPPKLHGCLHSILPSLAMMLRLPIPGLREKVLEGLLGAHPDRGTPLGTVVSFEAWGIPGEGPVPEGAAEALAKGELHLHPGAVEQRHVVAFIAGGLIVHIRRTRGKQPELLDPAKSMALTEGQGIALDLAVITAAICEPAQAEPSLN